MTKNSMRWAVLALLFIATGLSFLDRQVLSMTIIKIQQEFHISDVQYGMINTAFLISYALMFTISGRLIDRMGAKTGLALSVAIWSVANSLHGVMDSFYHLLAFRFLLGIGEGGCFPGAAKSVYGWFGEKERALANGIAIGGSAIGAVVAPPLTTLIAARYGWRFSFVIPGLIGMVWVLCWLLIPWKKNIFVKELPMEPSPPAGIPLLSLLQNKQVQVFVIIRFLLDPVMYFIMFWGPKYLSEQRRVPFERIGELFWIPFLALGISNIIGGWCSDRLIQYNFTINRARKTVMGIAAAGTMVMPLVTRVSSVEAAIVLMAMMLFAHGLWITNYITAISDVFGNSATSTVVGLSGTAGALSGLVINPLIGHIVHTYSYNPLWIIAGIMYPVAFVVLLLFIPRIGKTHVASRLNIYKSESYE
ncbi:MFS transporter [Chitinophaga sp.]|uniref:MFS transporter n=1 Tax=Chitinophaga sp. TaxID=1869181 RepID=UPI002C417F32|nr:MFS transporter [Chitinophaga sp.]HWV67005.1 MFS transporter [Chitinophaga sp.]